MTTTRNRLKRLLPAALLLFSFHCLQAQVNIGSGQTPHNFSILELASDSKGLRLPQLTTVQRDAWRDYFLGTIATNPANPSGTGITPTEKENARGLVIYNTDTGCLEYWNEKKWVSLCEGCATITSVSIIPSLFSPLFFPGGINTLDIPESTELVLIASTMEGTAYEWYVKKLPNGPLNLIETTNLNIHIVPSTVVDDPGTYEYHVKAINACSDATSPILTLTIIPAPV